MHTNKGETMNIKGGKPGNLGNRTKGSRRWAAKLTEDDVLEIKLNRQGLSVKEMAVKHGVSASSVYRVLRGDTFWGVEAP